MPSAIGRLTQESRSLLVDLLSLTQSSPERIGVDAEEFRIKNKDVRHVINELDRAGLITRREQTQQFYRLTFLGLTALQDNETAKNIVHVCERIFEALRTELDARPKD